MLEVLYESMSFFAFEFFYLLVLACSYILQNTLWQIPFDVLVFESAFSVLVFFGMCDFSVH